MTDVSMIILAKFYRMMFTGTTLVNCMN